MNIKSFLLVLKSTLNEKYPNLKVDFYVSCRNRYVHMGLDQPLHLFSSYEKLIDDIESVWTARKHNGSFGFFYPELIHSVKWKYDYVFLKKKVWLGNCVFLELVCVIFKRQSGDARVPLRAHPTSAGYDLYAVESKSLKPREWA